MKKFNHTSPLRDNFALFRGDDLQLCFVILQEIYQTCP